MGNPIVKEQTEDGEVRSKLKPSNLEPGDEFPLKLLRVSQPYDGKYSPYIFAEVETGDGQKHTIIVSHNTKAPGFLDDGEKTPFEEAFKEEHGESPQRETPGRSLAEYFYEAPLESDETRLIRETGRTEDGAEFSLYFFGLPEDQESTNKSIKWRD